MRNRTARKLRSQKDLRFERGNGECDFCATLCVTMVNERKTQ